MIDYRSRPYGHWSRTFLSLGYALFGFGVTSQTLVAPFVDGAESGHIAAIIGLDPTNPAVFVASLMLGVDMLLFGIGLFGMTYFDAPEEVQGP